MTASVAVFALLGLLIGGMMVGLACEIGTILRRRRERDTSDE
jgi:hypothetical protein